MSDARTSSGTPATTPAGPAAGTAAFGRLAPFIQEFIWKHGWTELREIQVQAIAAAFDTDDHLLLAAGTASGKTEAAFLPILTQLATSPPSTVGALYVGPLKALINDQFLRLGDLCAEAEIPVTAWHGDVGASRKHALLKRPSGILQITPEALEGLLLNRASDLMRVFGDLRWVVIDEVHAFMASDRGGQVLSLLDRLARFSQNRERRPRRVGLSATLGDYSEASVWLAGTTGRNVQVIAETHDRTVYLLMDRFTVAPERRSSENSAAHDVRRPGEASTDAMAADQLIVRQPDFFRAMYDATLKQKSLVFTNSRSDAEEVITGLRRLAECEGTPDIYYVHHGSIAGELRTSAEAAMRDGEGPACTAATVTLELGIDLGQLDRILQVGATFSVASFLQRLGRAGRRGQRPEMFFLLRDEARDAKAPFLERVPWHLIQMIAIIQLYAEEKWIEPLPPAELPGSLLYQQTMSVVGAAGELTPRQLAERVLTLAPFARVSQDDFRMLLQHLIVIDHLERTAEGGLILGLAGEKVVRSYRFLATFQDTTEWAVKDGMRDIGTIASPVPPGERFALAGRTWEVLELVSQERILIVRRVRGALRTHFIGGAAGNIHDRIVGRMRRVLAEDTVYTYMTTRAAECLTEGRQMARAAGIVAAPSLVRLAGDRMALVPWAGTRAVRTLALRIAQAGFAKVTDEGFYLVLSANSGVVEDLIRGCAAIAEEPWDAMAIAGGIDRALCLRGKYDEFLPDELLRKSFALSHLDVATAADRLGAALIPAD